MTGTQWCLGGRTRKSSGSDGGAANLSRNAEPWRSMRDGRTEISGDTEIQGAMVTLSNVPHAERSGSNKVSEFWRIQATGMDLLGEWQDSQEFRRRWLYCEFEPQCGALAEHAGWTYRDQRRYRDSSRNGHIKYRPARCA